MIGDPPGNHGMKATPEHPPGAGRLSGDRAFDVPVGEAEGRLLA
jgi:hypothetical protein